MSRRRTKAEDIKNPEHFFNRYIAMEIRHDREAQNAYDNMFDSLDELLSGSENGISKTASKLLDASSGERDLEEMLCNTSLLAWIDYIDNPRLYEGIRSLTNNQQIFVTLRFRLCYTQKEIADFFQVTQQSILNQEKRIIKKLKIFLKEGC